MKVLAVDLLNPTPQAEARKHKLKTLVPAPRSFFMDVKCPGKTSSERVGMDGELTVIKAALPSPPSSHTLRPSSFAKAAVKFYANPPVERLVSQKAARSGGSRRTILGRQGFEHERWQIPFWRDAALFRSEFSQANRPARIEEGSSQKYLYGSSGYSSDRWHHRAFSLSACFAGSGRHILLVFFVLACGRRDGTRMSFRGPDGRVERGPVCSIEDTSPC